MINKVNLYEHISENINKYSNIKKIKDDIIINTNSKRISDELREKINDHLNEISIEYNKKNDILRKDIDFNNMVLYVFGKLRVLKHNKLLLNNEYKDYIFTLIDEHGELLYKLQDSSNYE
jgi:anaerobic ribonucleoside-triphosphate reductase